MVQIIYNFLSFTCYRAYYVYSFIYFEFKLLVYKDSAYIKREGGGGLSFSAVITIDRYNNILLLFCGYK